MPEISREVCNSLLQEGAGSDLCSPLHSFSLDFTKNLAKSLQREGSQGWESRQAAESELGKAPMHMGLEKHQGAADGWVHTNRTFTLAWSFLRVAEVRIGVRIWGSHQATKFWVPMVPKGQFSQQNIWSVNAEAHLN